MDIALVCAHQFLRNIIYRENGSLCASLSAELLQDSYKHWFCMLHASVKVFVLFFTLFCLILLFHKQKDNNIPNRLENTCKKSDYLLYCTYQVVRKFFFL